MPENVLRLSAWIASPDPRALASLRKNASKLTSLYLPCLKLGDEGFAARSSTFSAAQRTELCAAGVEIWLESDCQDESLVFRMVSDNHCADFHAKGLIKLALEDQAKGLLLNYGEVRVSALPAFKAFAKRLKSLGNASGLKLGLVGAPEGLEVDIAVSCPLAPMRPGALAGMPWVAQQIQGASGRASFAFPGLGFHWQVGQARPLDFEAWAVLVEKHGPARRDLDSAELMLHWDGQEAWYCDSIAALRKLWLARQAGISQAALWSLGYEDPRLWDMLEDFPIPFALEKNGL